MRNPSFSIRPFLISGDSGKFLGDPLGGNDAQAESRLRKQRGERGSVEVRCVVGGHEFEGGFGIVRDLDEECAARSKQFLDVPKECDGSLDVFQGVNEDDEIETSPHFAKFSRVKLLESRNPL